MQTQCAAMRMRKTASTKMLITRTKEDHVSGKKHFSRAPVNSEVARTYRANIIASTRLRGVAPDATSVQSADRCSHDARYYADTYTCFTYKVKVCTNVQCGPSISHILAYQFEQNV